MESNEKLIAATEVYFVKLQKTYFSDELNKLRYRQAKCIELKVDYVEKKKTTFQNFSFFFGMPSIYRTALVYA